MSRAGIALAHGDVDSPDADPLTERSTCQDCSYDLMIDPMAADTVKRPSANLRRRRGREALAAQPSTPVDHPPGGSLEQRAENTSVPATRLLPESADALKTDIWAWSRAETARRRHADATRPTLAPIDTFPDEYSTADDLATTRLDVDPNATGPNSQTIRGLLGGACAGWRARPTSVELYDALRADNPTNRQRSIATVLINEASFEDLVNAHTEGAFTWRQLARAARRQGTVPPLRIRQINAFATPAPRPGRPIENLTLPEPAASLGAAKRGIVHAIPLEMFGRIILPHLGGGRIPAARWKHRVTDIDVLLPGRNTPIDLRQDYDRIIANELGGTSARFGPPSTTAANARSSKAPAAPTST